MLSELALAQPAPQLSMTSAPVSAGPLAGPPAELPAGPPAEVSVARNMVRYLVRYLVDRNTFTEFGSQVRHRAAGSGTERSRPAGDGVVTGVAEVGGRPVAVYAQDPRSLGGSLGEMHTAKIVRIMNHAVRGRTPVIGLIDSSGGRIQEGVDALDGCGALLRTNVALSGRVPQISVVLGSCAGGATLSPAMTDVVVMAADRGQMFLTGPRVVRAVTHEDVTAEMLGGPEVHARRSGLVHLLGPTGPDALAIARHVLSYLPSSCDDLPPVVAPQEAEPMPLIPDNQRLTYDVRTVIGGVVDGDSFLEFQAWHARNLVIGLARIEGATVGVVANQPQALAGTLNIAAAEKGARFVRMCDAFGIPLVVLVDTPGYLPGLSAYVPTYDQQIHDMLPSLGSNFNTTSVSFTSLGQTWQAAVEQRSGGTRPGMASAFAYWNSIGYPYMLPDLPFLFGLYPGIYAGTMGIATGNIVDNANTVYQLDGDPALSAAEQQLNADVLRVSANATADAAVVSGTPPVPVLSMHGIGDLFVPFSQEQIYAQRVAAHGLSSRLVSRAIRGNTHCGFTDAELQDGFADLVNWVDNEDRPPGDSILDPRAVADPRFGCRFTDGAHPEFSGASCTH